MNKPVKQLQSNEEFATLFENSALRGTMKRWSSSYAWCTRRYPKFKFPSDRQGWYNYES